MDLGVAGKTALVTASSRGLGRAAGALSEEGASVVLCARGEEALRQAAEAMPGDALAIAADVTDPATPQRLVDAAVERFGALHILVANAGGPHPAGPSSPTTPPSRQPSTRTCSAPSAWCAPPCSTCGWPGGAGSA